MTISFYKGFTRNLEIEKNPVGVLPNIWRLGRVKNTKFGMNVSNKILCNSAKCQGYSFYHFWVIKGKPTGGKITPTQPPRLGLRDIQRSMSSLLDTRFHIWLIMTLYYKMRQILLQNATAILLQNATEVCYKMRQVFYYKMWQFYYKMRQLFQIATVLLQIAIVQWVIHKIQIKLIHSSYISLHIQILSSDIYFFMWVNFSHFARIVFF